MTPSDPGFVNVGGLVYGTSYDLTTLDPTQVAYVSQLVTDLNVAGVDASVATAGQVEVARNYLDPYWGLNPAINTLGVLNYGAVYTNTYYYMPPPYQLPRDQNITGPYNPTPAPYVPPAAPAPAAKTPSGTPETTPSTSPGPQNLGDPFLPPGTGTYCDMFPDDPLCQPTDPGQGPPTVVIIYGGGGGGTGGTKVIVEGPSGKDVTHAVDAALGDLWDATVGAVDNVVADAINGIQKVLTDLGNALKAAWDILSRLAGLILAFLQHLLLDVIRAIVDLLEKAAELAQDLYKKVILPIAQGIIKLRDALIDVYQRFIRPMLIVLQDLRKVLSILAAFHVGFARKLDQKLAQLEARITAPFLYVLSFLNGIANWVNLIITAGYLLQKSVFLNSLLAYVGEALNLQLNTMNQPPSSGAIAAAAAANTVPTATQANAELKQFIETSSGPLTTGMQPYVDLFNGYIASGPY